MQAIEVTARTAGDIAHCTSLTTALPLRDPLLAALDAACLFSTNA
jgi:hypothetical protein